MKPQWVVSIMGSKGDHTWEIAVVREDNTHGLKSFGWFDECKLLVSHNGGPCHWPIVGFVWDAQVHLAHDLCAKLNAGEVVR